ncbi:MAG: DUF2279 domain-containing protein [Bacteroidota bacterium]
MPGFRTAFSLLLLFLFSAFTHLSTAQSSLPRFHVQRDFKANQSFFLNDTLPNKKRSRWIAGMAGGGYGLAALYMGTAWYGQEELSSFHFFDDSHEWKQIDKFGHLLGSYTGSRWMIDLFRWSGMPKRKAILIGSTSGFLAMSSIEVFDGFGENWGFSWSDVGANFLGASLAAVNQLAWNENRLQLKVSYHRSAYTGTDNPDFNRLFGNNFAEWVLKDYNGHNLWLSIRVHDFLPESAFKDRFPPWLNLAVGYGAEGLEGGYDDPMSNWRTREYRQLYLSLDIDPTHIKTRSGFLNALFRTVNLFRIPLPAIRFDRQGVALRPWE